MNLPRSFCSKNFVRLIRFAGFPGRIVAKTGQAGFLPVLLLSFLLLAGDAEPVISAESAVTCHCFQNRSYNPADRFAADDYILATGFNNLLARVFAVPHRQIVLLKMKEGVNEDDLLSGMYVSRKSGKDLQKILALRRAGQSWPAILASIREESEAEQDKIFSRLSAGAAPGEVASLVADTIMREFYQVPPAAIQQLRREDLNKKEINLVLLLAHASESRPEKLVQQYRKKGRSWSEIASSLGLEPREMGRLIQAYQAAAIPP